MHSNPSAASGGDPQPEKQSVVAASAKVGPSIAATRVSSQTLFAGANEVEIEHRGALYRLRQTSLGKLILTK
jgi:hemin uptake protein HemP